MQITEILSNILSDSFNESGFVGVQTKVVPCVIESMGDFQCNDAMQLAKVFHKSPVEIAKCVVEHIKPSDAIEKLEVKGAGFINIFVKDEFLCDCAVEFVKNVDAEAKLLVKQKKRTIVDYGGANVAKPLHIGHLRSTIIGESIRRINVFLGNPTLGDTHLGDWGLQMGLIIAEIEDERPNLVYFDPNFDGKYPEESPVSLADLETIYPRASSRSKEDPEFMERARKATFELQNGNRGYFELWKKFLEVSVRELKKIYDMLGARFDLWLGESDSEPYIRPIIEKLTREGFAKRSQGALVVDVSEPDDKANIPPVMLEKSDGSVLYHTTELATIVMRKEKYNAERVIYLADNRQSLHFNQVFRCVKKTNLVQGMEFEFVGFGTMNGADGKPFKTRDGGVMKLLDLINILKKKAFEKVMERGERTGDEQNISDVVAIAALKFADLLNLRSKDYIFDIDKFCSFEGKTGPYILYTITRIKSMLKKCPQPIHDKIHIYSDIERQIVKHLCSFLTSLQNAYTANAPSYICDYAYTLANLFSTFYTSCNVSKEEDPKKQSSYINLISLCLCMLEKCMDLLAIETLDKM